MFVAHLTCALCGLVLEWAGTRFERTVDQLEPNPITAGDLRAQMIESGRRPYNTPDTSRWQIIETDGSPVGVIEWGCTPRGRFYWNARLDAWPAQRTVEASTPLAALKALTRAIAKSEKKGVV